MSTTPEEFDIESWLLDANLPEESADVYKGGHLVAELQALKRRIETNDVVPDEERTAADKSEMNRLLVQYAATLQQYVDTKLTVYVQALGPGVLQELRKEHEQKWVGNTSSTAEANADFGFELMAKAVVGIRVADGPRLPVKWSAAQIEALAKAIGDPQFELLLMARQKAQNTLPEVDADFLQRRSGVSQAPEG
jgi:hypothetical protein